MDLAAILLLIALLLGVGLYLAAPLLGDRIESASEQTPEFSALMAERDRIISALAELDFDYKLGKIPQGDYPIQRAGLLKVGAEILKELDILSPRLLARQDKASLESRLQSAASSQLGPEQAGSGPLSDEEIESMLAARRKLHKSTSAGFCPRCGKPLLTTDQFCPHCGKELKLF